MDGLIKLHIKENTVPKFAKSSIVIGTDLVLS